MTSEDAQLELFFAGRQPYTDSTHNTRNFSQELRMKRRLRGEQLTPRKNSVNRVSIDSSSTEEARIERKKDGMMERMAWEKAADMARKARFFARSAELLKGQLEMCEVMMKKREEDQESEISELRSSVDLLERELIAQHVRHDASKRHMDSQSVVYRLKQRERLLSTQRHAYYKEILRLREQLYLLQCKQSDEPPTAAELYEWRRRLLLSPVSDEEEEEEEEEEKEEQEPDSEKEAAVRITPASSLDVARFCKQKEKEMEEKYQEKIQLLKSRLSKAREFNDEIVAAHTKLQEGFMEKERECDELKQRPALDAQEDTHEDAEEHEDEAEGKDEQQVQSCQTNMSLLHEDDFEGFIRRHAKKLGILKSSEELTKPEDRTHNHAKMDFGESGDYDMEKRIHSRVVDVEESKPEFDLTEFQSSLLKYWQQKTKKFRELKPKKVDAFSQGAFGNMSSIPQLVSSEQSPFGSKESTATATSRRISSWKAHMKKLTRDKRRKTLAALPNERYEEEDAYIPKQSLDKETQTLPLADGIVNEKDLKRVIIPEASQKSLIRRNVGNQLDRMNDRTVPDSSTITTELQESTENISREVNETPLSPQKRPRETPSENYGATSIVEKPSFLEMNSSPNVSPFSARKAMRDVACSPVIWKSDVAFSEKLDARVSENGEEEDPASLKVRSIKFPVAAMLAKVKMQRMSSRKSMDVSASLSRKDVMPEESKPMLSREMSLLGQSAKPVERKKMASVREVGTLASVSCSEIGVQCIEEKRSKDSACQTEIRTANAEIQVTLHDTKVDKELVIGTGRDEDSSTPVVKKPVSVVTIGDSLKKKNERNIVNVDNTPRREKKHSLSKKRNITLDTRNSKASVAALDPGVFSKKNVMSAVSTTLVVPPKSIIVDIPTAHGMSPRLPPGRSPRISMRRRRKVEGGLNGEENLLQNCIECVGCTSENDVGTETPQEWVGAEAVAGMKEAMAEKQKIISDCQSRVDGLSDNVIELQQRMECQSMTLEDLLSLMMRDETGKSASPYSYLQSMLEYMREVVECSAVTILLSDEKVSCLRVLATTEDEFWDRTYSSTVGAPSLCFRTNGVIFDYEAAYVPLSHEGTDVGRSIRSSSGVLWFDGTDNRALNRKSLIAYANSIAAFMFSMDERSSRPATEPAHFSLPPIPSSRQNALLSDGKFERESGSLEENGVSEGKDDNFVSIHVPMPPTPRMLPGRSPKTAVVYKR